MARNEYPVNDWSVNIRAAYDAASIAQRERGESWYRDYGVRIAQHANDANVPVDAACAIVAVSSINSRPEPGLSWSVRIMNGATGGHLPLVCERAARIMADRWASFDTLRNIACDETSPRRKVRSFACNIRTLGLPCEHGDACVTIDRWANYVATNGKDKSVPAGPKYDALARAYRMVAADLGIAPAIVQAVTWVMVAE